MSALPATMTCVEIKKPGGPEALVPTTRPVPQAKDGEILIKVAAAGVNRPDLAQRAGLYPPPPGASDLPGLEAAGTVAALGAGVSGWKLGDTVCALTPGGGYAEYCTAPAPQCLPVPKGFDMLRAAALPENYFTVWHNLFERGQLKSGESALIHGGASGIGTTAIQLAKDFGATVAVTAGSEDRLKACRELGADIAINHRDEDFVQRVKDATGGRGADVILDIIGAKYLDRNIDALAADGRIACIGMQGGAKAELDMSKLMVKRATLSCTTLRARPAEQKAAIVAAVREDVWPLVEAGSIRPVVYRELPFAEAAEAHRIMAESTHIGKLILRAE